MDISNTQRQRATNWATRQARVSDTLSLIETAGSAAVALLAAAAWIIAV